MPKTLAQVKTYNEQSFKSTYGVADTQIHSKKQLAYSVKNYQATTAETLVQNAYHVNVFTTAIKMHTMHPLARACLVSHEYAYLRDGYVQRKYGRVQPQGKDAFPEPGQPITPTAAYKVPMLDDYSGNTPGELVTKHDVELFQNRKAFIDAKDYENYLTEIAHVVGKSMAQPYNVALAVFLMSSGPGVTMTEDLDIAGFLNPAIRPDEQTNKAAYDGFNPAGIFWKLMKEQVGAAVQAKGLNCDHGSPAIYNPMELGIEIPKPPEQKHVTQDNYKDYMKWFTKKEDEKVRLHHVSRFITLYGLCNEIREKVLQVTTINTPRNLCDYDPSDPAAPTNIQISGVVDPSDLFLCLNTFDKAEIELGTTNTSPNGNYTLSLSDVSNLGVRIFGHDAIMPCHFKLGDKKMFILINVLAKFYETDLNFALAKQVGYFDYTIATVLGKCVAYHGIGVGVCPSAHYLQNHYKAFSAHAQ